jgi:ribosomal protein L11 methylase PrmA
MYLWRKLAGRSWLAAQEQALRSVAGHQLAIIQRPNRLRLELEVASQSYRRVGKLQQKFGGSIEKLPRDWRKRYLHQQKTSPLKIGGKKLIIPAGAAFGTGAHATTAMCLRLLEQVIRSPAVVVDLGTGSGILALAASRLGARRVIAIDNDPLAISVARENARRNKVDNVRFELADLRRRKFARTPDITVANLFSELLLEILPELRGVSRLILSGILRTQEQEVIGALKRNKIDIIEVRRRGKWVSILAGQLRRS